MNGAEPQKTNNLVQNTRAVGQAVRGGDLAQARELAQKIVRDGGSMSAKSGNHDSKPTQLPHLTRKSGGQDGTPHRAVYQDRPPQGQGR
jgi:general stress protein YciG